MKRWLLLVGLGLQVFGWFLFGNGFFPLTQPLEGISTVEEQSRWSLEGDGKLGRYDRSVFIVIDAFRADFIYNQSVLGSNRSMPFIQNLIEQNEAIPLIGKAQAPTVTLPRIKALVSGSLPSFWDFVENFNSPSLQQDSLLHQFRQYNWKTCFYGDDTWLHLFPPEDKFFIRHEGTTSFFVADTVEVDNNVTRCLYQEMKRNQDENNLETQCEALILHYLGLDHIGHYQGPRSALLPPKLLEMDDIVNEIYDHITQQDKKRCAGQETRDCGSLLIITGDHGMNELGNHGGSSPLEIETALILIDPKWKQNKLIGRKIEIVNQVDLIPSLSLLFDLPIPKNSLGKIISSSFAHHNPEELLRAYGTNADQLLQVIQGHEKFWVQGVPQTQEISDIWNEYISLTNSMSSLFAIHAPKDKTVEAQKMILRYEKLVSMISEQFVELLTEYDTNKLFIGVVLLFLSCCVFSYSAYEFLREWKILYWDAMHVVEFILFVIGFLLFYSSLFTSSFVEEEHQIWYFLISSICLVYLVICISAQPTRQFTHRGEHKVSMTLKIIGLLASQRLMRSWNQTGNKWIHLLDIGDILESYSSYIIILSCMLASVILYTYIILRKSFLRGWNTLHSFYVLTSSLFCCITLVLVKIDHVDANILHNIIEKPNVNLLIQLSYCVLVLQGIFCVLMFLCKFHVRQKDSFLLFLRVPVVILFMLLHKPRNQLLLLIMVANSLQLQSMLRSCLFYFDYQCRDSYLPALRTIILTMWYSKASYFILGNSNSLSSIDIGGAYTGLSGYNEGIVVVFAGFILYSGPIIYSFLLIDFVICFPGKARRFIMLLEIVWGGIHSVTLFVFTCVIGILRYHLFIWSVFSPKFLFESLHTTFYIFGGIFFAVIYMLEGYLTPQQEKEKLN